MWYAKLDPKRALSNSHAYALMHSICGTAVKDGLLQANPCHIERAMNAQRKREPVMLTVAELAAVADKIRSERLRAGTCVAYREVWRPLG
jgi:hypothetical protein